MESKGIREKKGSSQDATFITSDPGHGKHDEPRNEGKTKSSKDGSHTKKNETYFGYKGHTIVDDTKHVRTINPMPSPRQRIMILPLISRNME